MPLLPASFDDDLLTPSSTPAAPPKRTLLVGNLDLNLSSSNLIPHSDGLCSVVYRTPLDPSAAWPYDPSSSSSSSCGSNLPPQSVDHDGVPGWVCVKRVAPDSQPKPHNVNREIALLSILKHPNLVELLAAILDESDPFGVEVDLVFPLYAATLEEVLEEPSLNPSLGLGERGELPRPGASIKHLWKEGFERFVEGIATQLLSGLAYLHKEGVAHRDLKPSNLLLSPNGMLKIIDLGTAHFLTSLPDPLGMGESEAEEGGRMVCQVGTGHYRAPELLFSPTKGYDAMAVDVWSMGVVLSHFFTPLTFTSSTMSSSSDMPSLDMPSLDLDIEHNDERQDWERAFHSSINLPSSPSSSDGGFWVEEEPLPPPPSTASGYIRQPLFEGDRGDIGLAGSIFALLGLPKSLEEWPEGGDFQPPLHRLPFAATEGKGLRSALPLLTYLPPTSLQVCEDVINPALQLSASKRPSAADLLKSLTQT